MQGRLKQSSEQRTFIGLQHWVEVVEVLAPM